MTDQQIGLLEDVCQKIYSTHDAAERKNAEQVTIDRYSDRYSQIIRSTEQIEVFLMAILGP